MHKRIAMHRHGEAALSIHEPSNPSRFKLDTRLKGFLLIFRTGRIVTAHAHTLLNGCNTMDEYRRILGCSSI